MFCCQGLNQQVGKGPGCPIPWSTGKDSNQEVGKRLGRSVFGLPAGFQIRRLGKEQRVLYLGLLAGIILQGVGRGEKPRDRICFGLLVRTKPRRLGKVRWGGSFTVIDWHGLGPGGRGKCQGVTYLTLRLSPSEYLLYIIMESEENKAFCTFVHCGEYKVTTHVAMSTEVDKTTASVTMKICQLCYCL